MSDRSQMHKISQVFKEWDSLSNLGYKPPLPVFRFKGTTTPEQIELFRKGINEVNSREIWGYEVPSTSDRIIFYIVTTSGVNEIGGSSPGPECLWKLDGQKVLIHLATRDPSEATMGDPTDNLQYQFFFEQELLDVLDEGD